jgi:hypothetical protein
VVPWLDFVVPGPFGCFSGSDILRR